MTFLAIGSAVTGLLATAFAGYLWPYRNRAGGFPFVAVMAAIALLSFTHAVALLTFAPLIRLVLELLVWVSVTLITAMFFLFGISYAGRQKLLTSKWVSFALGILVIGLFQVLTNPLHGIAWQGFEIDPVLGAATVSYTPAIGLYFYIVWGFVLTGAGLFFLVETFLSYGSLFRDQTLALAVSVLPPSATQVVWLLGIGPYPQLNLTPFGFSLTIGLLAYAFFRRELLDLTPVARRAGERTALEDLSTAIFIVDETSRIVNLNRKAERILGGDTTHLGDNISDHFPDLDIEQEDHTVEIVVEGQRCVYNIVTTPVTDTGEEVIGYTIVLHDVTVERRQRQQLSVLNRVLRHNLRTSVNVIQGNLVTVEDEIDDPEKRAALSTVREKTESLLDLAEKARKSEDLIESAAKTDEQVDMGPLLRDVATEAEQFAGTVEVNVPDGVSIQGSERILRVVFRNLIENGLQHNNAVDPRVVVNYEPLNGRVQFDVSDNGPGIPEHEMAALDQLEETPMRHSSGLGLWITVWLLEQLGGDMQFETDSVEGTRVLVDLPAPSDTGSHVASGSSTT